MEKNREFKELISLMQTYDKDYKTKRTRTFLGQFFSVNINKCMPLSEEELYIYRRLTGVLPEMSKEELAKSLNISEETLNKKIRIIKSVLRLYFYDVKARKRRYNKTINENNENITIFDIGLSNESLYSLRLIKCYYLKDATTARPETLEDVLSYPEYLKVINAMEAYGMKFDSQVYRFRR